MEGWVDGGMKDWLDRQKDSDKDRQTCYLPNILSLEVPYIQQIFECQLYANRFGKYSHIITALLEFQVSIHLLLETHSHCFSSGLKGEERCEGSYICVSLSTSGTKFCQRFFPSVLSEDLYKHVMT